MNYDTSDASTRRPMMVVLVGVIVALAIAGTWSFAAARADAAYQGPFCNNKFLYEYSVCDSGNFSHSRRVIGHSYKSHTWVALYGTNCGTGSKCRSNACYSSGCTADTGYYGSYGSGCGSSCAAQIQNYSSPSSGDWFFGYIYE